MSFSAVPFNGSTPSYKQTNIASPASFPYTPCYAEDMNSEFAHWDHSKQHYDPQWVARYPEGPPPPVPCALPYAFPEQPVSQVPHLVDGFGQMQLGRIPKTRTSPVTTRTRITRHGSQPGPGRPSSSGGEVALHRSFAPPRRSESYSHPTPLEDFRNSRRWPPSGYSHESELLPEEAEDLIATGASTFKGYCDAIPNAPEGYDRFYAVMQSEHQARTDRATFQQAAYKDITLDLTGTTETQFPWLALEQPCMASAFGKSAGTTTLNHWVSSSGYSMPAQKFVANTRPRRIKLLQILDRLQKLESGLNEDDPEEMYRYLYSTLIEDPERFDDHRHIRIDQQIADLITVLSNPHWVDFSEPRNQVVAKFFDSSDQQRKQEFFHQLLLSVELYLRIHSKEHTDKSKTRLMNQLPPAITWDLAVAQRWLENMQITKSRVSPTQSTFSFDLKSKNRQKEALRIFAATLKWPNMDELEYVLDETDPQEKPLEDRSADAMSWFSGIVLPGKTLPWLIMNSLIDCDKDTGGALTFLTHMQPASGFQYRANTYWSAQCIVGKVLGAARGVKQIAGWIGPCIYTPDLKRTECVKIKQYESPDPRLTEKDVSSMNERSDPLGAKAESYPVDEYEVPMPDTEDVTDQIRMEKLSFIPAKEQPASARKNPHAPLMFDAAISFACGGASWPLRLKYNIDFINAFPCYQGPHVLFYDFEYKAMKIDDGLVDLNDWGRRSGRMSRPNSSRSSSARALALANDVGKSAHEQVNNVLVIEALGVSDNEVFARAWCAHHGHSAIVANIKETCMSCAIREAYAACVSVVILTEGGVEKENDTGVYEDF